MKKAILTALTAVAILALTQTSAQAVPDLQLYIPGATYITGSSDPWLSQTWYTPESTFELWVIAANTPLHNVDFAIAIPGDDTGNVTFTNSANQSKTLTYDPPTQNDFKYGNPFGKNREHGVYSTWYTTYSIGDIPLGSEIVKDMVGGGTGYGTILKFNFTKTGLDKVHFDAYGYDDKGHFKFAPFSHDAQDGPPPPVPEPFTVSLVGMGIAGLAALRRKS